MSRSRASILSLATISLIALCGCGHAVKVGASRTVSIALSEYRLKPHNVTVSEGLINFDVHNYGRVTHNLVVSAKGVGSWSTKALWPGQGTELSLDLAPGTYSMASTMLSDQDLGEYGTLTVTR
jgi:hypothetical protein